MTPDDVEAVASEWLAMVETVEPDRFVESLRYPPICQSERDALRALLLDYQERGRALEELLASTVGPEVGAGDGGTFVIQPPSPDALRRARATLKGKSHE